MADHAMRMIPLPRKSENNIFVIIIIIIIYGYFCVFKFSWKEYDWQY